MPGAGDLVAGRSGTIAVLDELTDEPERSPVPVADRVHADAVAELGAALLARGEVAPAYDTIAADYAAAFPTTEPETADQLAMVDAFVEALPGSPFVLDAGCGTGRMSRYLADHGCRTQGIDLSPGMVAQARATHPELPCEVGDLARLPYANEAFDGVLAWYSLIHTHDSEIVLVARELTRVLRVGGFALVASQAPASEHDLAIEWVDHGGATARIPRYHRSADRVRLLFPDLAERARLERGAVGRETSPQTVLLLERVR